MCVWFAGRRAVARAKRRFAVEKKPLVCEQCRGVLWSVLRPTRRAADTASPWASRGGWSGEVASPAVVVGRRRRAADALVGRTEA